MRAIVNCQTPALGGQRLRCVGCDFERFVYHSCRNRHCPKCQIRTKEAWREARQSELLPVPYFHQVFTLPHELNEWVLASESNQRRLLKLLFDAVSATLLEFGRNELGGQVGFTLVLHTWDQQLRPHFHLHCLIASGALSWETGLWRAGGAKFLFLVRALSKVFRGKFTAGLELLLEAEQLDRPLGKPPSAAANRKLVRQLRRKSWVVYSKAPFAGPRRLLDYLSRYTHRVAISNNRLVAFEEGEVEFSYRDRNDGDRRKNLKLPVDAFIRRFLLHVLPDRFVRIRHYGFLANCHRHEKLAAIRIQLGVAAVNSEPNGDCLTDWLQETLGIDQKRCPHCGGNLVGSEVQPSRPTTILRRWPVNLRGPPERSSS